MLYIIILFIFNILILVLLANVKIPSVNCIFHDFTRHQLEKTMRLNNSPCVGELSKIEFDKLHSINIHFNEEEDDESK